MGSDRIQKADYVVIGHLTCDIIPNGLRLGGTVTFASLMAKAMGMQVGIVTSWDESLPLSGLEDIPIENRKVRFSTNFKNIETENGRIQYIYHPAENLEFDAVPADWREAKIIHIGPVAQEISPRIIGNFPHSLVGVTLQGWMRAWDEKGIVRSMDWSEFTKSERFSMLAKANASVISVEDVARHENRIDDLAAACPILAVTEAEKGSRLFWQGKEYHFAAPQVEEVDPVGAGDMFAAAMFIRLQQTQDPLEAARFATCLAAYTVTRRGMQSAPTLKEIEMSYNGKD